VNFLSHAVLAEKRSNDPAYVLGSMLPDFASMAGLRIASVEDPQVSKGVDFHHAGDDAFHGAPLFLEMMGDARDTLETSGLDMGPAMAVSHVGLELLLDGWLVTREGAGAYRRAMLHAHKHGATVRWTRTRGQEQWQKICTRLRDAPIPERYVEPKFITERLQRMLAHRPRLALREENLNAVHAWTLATKPQLWERASELFDQVESRLATTRPSFA